MYLKCIYVKAHLVILSCKLASNNNSSNKIRHKRSPTIISAGIRMKLQSDKHTRFTYTHTHPPYVEPASTHVVSDSGESQTLVWFTLRQDGDYIANCPVESCTEPTKHPTGVRFANLQCTPPHQPHSHVRQIQMRPVLLFINIDIILRHSNAHTHFQILIITHTPTTHSHTHPHIQSHSHIYSQSHSYPHSRALTYSQSLPRSRQSYVSKQFWTIIKRTDTKNISSSSTRVCQSACWL